MGKKVGKQLAMGPISCFAQVARLALITDYLNSYSVYKEIGDFLLWYLVTQSEY